MRTIEGMRVANQAHARLEARGAGVGRHKKTSGGPRAGGITPHILRVIM